MIWIAISAAFVGFLHTLTPGHWLPVVLVVRSKQWSMKMAVVAALATAAGHMLFSLLLSVCSIVLGVSLFSHFEFEIERYAGLGLAIFGLIYASMNFSKHAHCRAHTHHPVQWKGAEWDVNHPPQVVQQQRAPFLFLFSLGFSPCITVLPIFAAAAAEGTGAVILSFLSFCVGVTIALVGVTTLVCLGLLKWNTSLFEHHGDTITGLGITVIGIILFFMPHG